MKFVWQFQLYLYYSGRSQVENVNAQERFGTNMINQYQIFEHGSKLFTKTDWNVHLCSLLFISINIFEHFLNCLNIEYFQNNDRYERFEHKWTKMKVCSDFVNDFYPCSIHFWSKSILCIKIFNLWTSGLVVGNWKILQNKITINKFTVLKRNSYMI